MKQKLSRTLLSLALSAIALPAMAVNSINACGTINAPGAYRLAQNLNFQGANLEACLKIKASNVSIDMQGHTITGTGIGTGISADENPPLSNIEIRNGTVRSFRSGISLSVTSDVRVERMQVLDNTFAGISVSTDSGGAIVSSNIVARTDGRGILVSGDGTLVVDNSVVHNNGTGIDVRAPSTVRGNVSNHNGATGISVRCPALLIDNTAVSNRSGDLFSVGTGCRVSNNLIQTSTN